MTAADGPRPPDTIQVGPWRVRVLVDADAVAHEAVKRSENVMGYFASSELVIGVSPDLHPDQVADTLLHEVLHAVVTASGLNADEGAPLDDHKAEELVVAVLSTALLDLMRRNPELLAFLTAD